MSENPITFKFIIVGNSAVGKSCLLLRFDEGRFQPIHDVTVGVTFSIKMIKIGGQSIKVQVWDTAGQEIFRSITRSYYRDSACAIIVYDITDATSFNKVEEWIRDVRNLAPPDCLIVLFGNKLDLASQRAVPTSQGQELADRNGIMFFETSALTGENVENAFNECINTVYSNNKTANNPDESKVPLDQQGKPGNTCC
ncbi:small rab-related GTPase [Histomonas meleagridis]|uniref:small rab-related GTPase n=1 Tax=Histomonas meleagridis TaxID=135588 RepID=UPI00355AAA7A|nr:small rab-related GTPase [Histomonas meleagridis]KAH0799554.1 small rab-related GTPase [Histomonas meleagridis]